MNFKLLNLLTLLLLLLFTSCMESKPLTVRVIGGDTNVVDDTDDDDEEVAPFSVTIVPTSDQELFTNSVPISFSVTFGQPIDSDSLTADDIVQTGDAIVTSWSIEAIDAQTFIFTADTISTDGSIIPTIAEETVLGLEGGVNSAPTVATDAVVFDSQAPVIDPISDILTNTLVNVSPTVTEINLGSYSWTVTLGTAANITFGTNSASTSSIVATADGTYTINFTVTDLAGNSTSEEFSFVWDQSAPVVSSVVLTNADGFYTTGSVLEFIINFSADIDVPATPVLALNISRDATCVKSDTDQLTCSYTIQATDSTSDLTYASVNALSGTITYGAGNSAIKVLPAVNTITDVKAVGVDTTTPVIAAINNIATNSQVTVTPTVTEINPDTYAWIDTGATGNVVFGTASASATTISATVDGTYTIRFTVTDLAGLSAFREFTFTWDQSAPTVSSLVLSNADGVYSTSDSLSFVVEFTQDIVVTGTPRLAMNLGRSADCSKTAATQLTCSYTIVATDNVQDLAHNATNSLTLNSGTIKDNVGNDATLTLPAVNSITDAKAVIVDTLAPAIAVLSNSSVKVATLFSPVVTELNPDTYLWEDRGATGNITFGTSTASTTTISASTNGTYNIRFTVTDDAGLSSYREFSFTWDTEGPDVTTIALSNANGVYTVDDAVSFVITFDETITVTGSPLLALNMGRDATCSKTAATQLTCSYTIVATDNTQDLAHNATNALTLNAGTIKDSLENAAVLTLPAVSVITDAKAVKVDTTAPVIGAISNVTTNASTLVSPVVTELNPSTYAWSDVGATGNITFGTSSASTSTISASANGTYTIRFTVTDLAGQSVSDDFSFTWDQEAPTVSSLAISNVDGEYTIGEVVSFLVNFSKDIVVTGTPLLALNIGRNASCATSASNQMTCSYTIVATDNTQDLAHNATNALSLNSGTIKDDVGNNATLTLPAVSTITSTKAVVIDTTTPVIAAISNSTTNSQITVTPTVTELNPETYAWSDTGATGNITFGTASASSSTISASVDGTYTIRFTVTDKVGLSAFREFTLTWDQTGPTVSSLALTTNDGIYTTGGALTFTIDFTQDITVVGSPLLALNIARDATCSKTLAARLTCTYTIQSGDNTGDLAHNATNALSLNSGSIKDSVGNNATLTLPAVSTITDAKAVKVDTTAPAIAAIGNITTSTQSTVTPVITELNPASYAWSDTGATGKITFGSATASSSTIEASDTGTYTIRFTVTDQVTLSSYREFTFTWDQAPPAVTSIALSNADGTYTTDDVVSFTIDFSKDIVVTGTPLLALNIGRNASCSKTAAATLTCSYTIVATDNTQDLAHNATNALSLNSGTIKDSLDNAATLTLPAVSTITDAKAVKVDTTTPTVAAINNITTNTSTTVTPVITELNPDSYAWADTGATGNITFGTGTASSSTVSASQSGTYTIRFTVTDKAGLSAFREFTFVWDQDGPTVSGLTLVNADDVYTTGEAVSFYVDFSQNIEVTGTPLLALNIARNASCSKTDVARLTCSYTIVATDNTQDLAHNATNALSLNSGTIKDAVGNDATLTLPAVSTIINTKAVKIDTTTPAITAISDVNATITATVTPTVTELNPASYLWEDRGATGKITFGTSTASSSTITASETGSYTIRFTVTDAVGLSAYREFTFDVDVPPVVTAVDFVTADGTYSVNANIDIELTFSQAVSVTGFPRILLNVLMPNAQTATRYANYISGDDSTTLVFRYTVTNGDLATSLDYAATNSLTLNSGTIVSLADSVAATLTLPATGTLSGIVVDTSSNFFKTRWKTNNAGVRPATAFLLPLESSSSYNFKIYWGDGSYHTITTWNDVNLTHTYAVAGEYDVTIVGSLGRIYFNNAGDKGKLIGITQWGTNQWSTMANAFHGCSNLLITATDAPDLSQATSMKEMFKGASKVNASFNNWDVSTITDMEGLFYSAALFNGNITSWNTANVTNMITMFRGASVFNQNIGGWNVAKVTSMYEMFYQALAFNQDISNWNVAKVTDMTRMFYSADGFNNGGTALDWIMVDGGGVASLTTATNMFRDANLFNQDISSWNVSKVASFIYMFSGAVAFNNGGVALDWIMEDATNGGPAVTNMSYMFEGALAFNQDVSSWNVSAVTTMAYMFSNADQFDQDLSSWDVSNVLDMSAMFSNTAKFNQNLSNWDISKVTDLASMFTMALLFNNGGVPLTWNMNKISDGLPSALDMSNMFSGAAAFNQDVSSWDVSSVTNMTYMFEDAILFNQDLSDWDISKVTNLSYMFDNATAFNNGGVALTWDTTKVDGTASATTMLAMFRTATNFNQDISSWNVSKVTNFASMFNGATNFNNGGVALDWIMEDAGVPAATGMSSMFDGAAAFNQDVSTWNVSLVTSMAMMFQGATNFNQNLSNWNISKVANLSYMFNDAINFNNGGAPLTWTMQALGVPAATNTSYMFDGATAFNQSIATWDVSKVTTMIYMFRDAVTFNQNLSAWNIGKVTSMASMFSGATAFNNGGVALTWTMDQGGVYVTNTMAAMFFGATSFNQDISSWNVSMVTSMLDMFNGATSFNNGGVELDWEMEKADLTTSNLTFASMFEGATAFNQNLSSWNVSAATNLGFMFYNATSFNNGGVALTWDMTKLDNTPSVTTLSHMFDGATAFNQDVSSWDVSTVTIMTSMFQGATNFNNGGVILDWDMEKLADSQPSVTNMAGMFYGAAAFNQDISGWNVSKVTTISNMFADAILFNQDLSGWTFNVVPSHLAYDTNTPAWVLPKPF